MHLFRRLLRNTRNLEQMLDQFESLVELRRPQPIIAGCVCDHDGSVWTRWSAKATLRLVAGSMGILDRIVTNYTEDDIEQLGENIVLIPGIRSGNAAAGTDASPEKFSNRN